MKRVYFDTTKFKDTKNKPNPTFDDTKYATFKQLEELESMPHMQRIIQLMTDLTGFRNDSEDLLNRALQNYLQASQIEHFMHKNGHKPTSRLALFPFGYSASDISQLMKHLFNQIGLKILQEPDQKHGNCVHIQNDKNTEFPQCDQSLADKVITTNSYIKKLYDDKELDAILQAAAHSFKSTVQANEYPQFIYYDVTGQPPPKNIALNLPRDSSDSSSSSGSKFSKSKSSGSKQQRRSLSFRKSTACHKR